MTLDKPIKELENAIKLHIAFSGGITPGLGAVGLKLIDVLKLINEDKEPSDDINALTVHLIKSMVDSAITRVGDASKFQWDSLNSDHHATIVKINDELRNPTKEGYDQINLYLNFLADSIRLLKYIDDSVDYPTVTDSSGDSL